MSARAQNGPISIDKIDADLVDTPVYSVSTGPVTGAPPSKGGKWLQVDFAYSTASERGVLNEVQFRVYIEVQDLQTPDDKSGPPAVLTGEATVTSVPDSKELHGTFFIHPFVLQRFGGERVADYKQQKGKNIRIEAYVDGQQVAVKDKHDDDPNWVGPMKKIPGLVIPRDQSPWAYIGLDKFPPAKVRSGGSQ